MKPLDLQHFLLDGGAAQDELETPHSNDDKTSVTNRAKVPDTQGQGVGNLVSEARHDTPPRGDKLLAAAENIWNRAEKLLTFGLPREWNPFAHTGALAGFTFLIAAITGIALLIWYDTSVHTAYASIKAMEAQPWGSGLVRSLHRYSSDACVLLAVVHAIKLFLARRFTGARWLAWVTGIVLLALIWLDGWLGYWLTWDQRAQAIAVGTAQALDVLPIFPEPVARSFLTNDSVNSLIFFVVFFAHVLLPVPIGAVIWLHLARMRKPKLVPPRKLVIATMLVLVLVSLLVPATLAAPAEMAALSLEFEIDWFYLLPLFLTDRIEGWLFWVVAVAILALPAAIPLLLARRRRAPAEVNPRTCTGCTQCVQDCPFEAITMMHHEGRVELVALVDPARCVSCGICVGACDSGAMAFKELPRRDVRRQIDEWMDDHAGPRNVMFVCADSPGGEIRYDKASGLSHEVPDWRIVAVPCSGWVHSSLVELVVRKGGRCMIVGCGGDEPRCRLGEEVTRERASGARHPAFKPDRAAAGTLTLAYPQKLSDLVRQAAEAVRAAVVPKQSNRARVRFLVAGALTAGALACVMVLLSRFVYVQPEQPPAMFVFAFKHAGQEVEDGDAVETELKHLEGMKRRTRRMPVRVRISVDGQVVHDQSYPPRGIRGDSASVGTIELGVQPGEHEIEVAVSDSAQPDDWSRIARRSVMLEAGRRLTLQLDNDFHWDGDPAAAP